MKTAPFRASPRQGRHLGSVMFGKLVKFYHFYKPDPGHPVLQD